MIQIIRNSENYPRNLNNAVTTYINYNLLEIVNILIDYYEMDNEFDIFPLMDLYESRDSNLKLIYVLREIIENSSIRDRDIILPKYELTLFIILEWWGEVCNAEENLLPYKLDNKMKAIILENIEFIGEDYVESFIGNLCNYEYLYDRCFEDFDFLPSRISDLVQIYLHDKEQFEMIFCDVDLNKYIEVMPKDIRDLYIDELKEVNTTNLTEISEESILNEIYAVLLHMERRVLSLKDRSETELSNEMDLGLKRVLKLKHNLEVARETPIGRALVQLGETDIYIYQNTESTYKEIAILENKFIEKLEDEYYQLLGYLNKNFQFGVTIAINRKLNYIDAKEKLKDAISKWEIENGGFIVENVRQPFKTIPDLLMTTHAIPENPDIKMNIYHFILNLSDRFRGEVAIKARKPRKKKVKSESELN